MRIGLFEGRTAAPAVLRTAGWERGAAFAALAALPLLFLLIVLVYPLGLLFVEAFTEQVAGRTLFTLDRVVAVLTDPYYHRLLAFTAEQALLSALASLFIGLPVAYLFVRYDFPGKSWLRSVVLVPFVLPAVTVALGFILVFGNNGVVNRALDALFGFRIPILYSLQGIVLAHAFYNAPLVVRSVHAAWEAVDPSFEESARALGAGRWRAFFTVTLPMIAPGVVTGSLLAFVFSFMSFPIVLALGGARLATMEVEIYTQVRVLLDYGTGAALALVETVLSLLMTFVYLRVEARLRTRWLPARRQPTRPLRLSFRHAPWLALALVAGAFFLAPLLAVVWDALTRGAGGGLTLRWFAMLFNPGHHAIAGDSPLQAILNSLRFGAGTVLLALPMGVLASLALGRARWKGRELLELLALAPLGVSGVALGFGLLRATVRSPLAQGGAQWAIVAVHAVLALPFVVRTVRPALDALHPALAESARALGASRWRAFRDVELPLILRSLLLGGALAFSVSFSEMSATITLAPPGLATMPIAVYQLLSARSFGGASAMAVLLILVTGASFALLERWGGGKR
ncbi:MAG TPA: iron ABC transporter permease [Limnochorda sp.]